MEIWSFWRLIDFCLSVLFLQELQAPSAEEDPYLLQHAVQNNLQYLKAFSNLVVTDFLPPDKN